MVQKTLSVFQNNKNQSRKYFSELIPTSRQAYMARHKNSVLLLNVKHDYFKNSFFHSTIIEWSKLDSNRRNSFSLALFYKRILVFITLATNSTFECDKPKSLKIIKRLRLELNHLQFHKFKHGFQDRLNAICNCDTVERTVHYLLHCSNISNERLTLKLQSIDKNILSKDTSNISKVLLCGDH